MDLFNKFRLNVPNCLNKKKLRGWSFFEKVGLYGCALNFLYINSVNAFFSFLGIKFNFIVLLDLDAVQTSYVYKKVFFADVVCNKSVAF